MFSSLGDLVIALILLLFTLIWIYALRKGEESARRKLGDRVEVVMLSRRGVRIIYYILTGLAIALPILILLLTLAGRIEPDELIAQMVRAAWLGSLGYGLRRGSTVMVGSRGFSYGVTEMTPWKDVEDVTWDRDIGQRSWGASIVVKGKRPIKRRIYVRRDLKEHVAELFESFRGRGSS